MYFTITSLKEAISHTPLLSMFSAVLFHPHNYVRSLFSYFNSIPFSGIGGWCWPLSQRLILWLPHPLGCADRPSACRRWPPLWVIIIVLILQYDMTSSHLTTYWRLFTRLITISLPFQQTRKIWICWFVVFVSNFAGYWSVSRGLELRQDARSAGSSAVCYGNWSR